MRYNELAKEINKHNVSVGWWDNVTKNYVNTYYTKLMLSVSEVSEAMEGDRKQLPDDKIPHRSMLEVELADTMIRVLDLGYFFGLEIYPDAYHSDCQYFMRKLLKPKVATPVPVALFSIVCQIASMADLGKRSETYTGLVALIHTVCEYYNLDLEGAIADKRHYNASRADHKRENREKEHGKTY